MKIDSDKRNNLKATKLRYHNNLIRWMKGKKGLNYMTIVVVSYLSRKWQSQSILYIYIHLGRYITVHNKEIEHFRFTYSDFLFAVVIRNSEVECSYYNFRHV